MAFRQELRYSLQKGGDIGVGRRLKKMMTVGSYTERLNEALGRRAWRDVKQVGRRILKLDPSHLIAREAIAQAHWHLREYRSCLTVAKSLIVLNPHEPGYSLLQGMCHHMLGQYQAALSALHGSFEKSDREESRRQIQQQIAHVEETIVCAVNMLRQSDRRFEAAFDADPETAFAAIGIHTQTDVPSVMRALIWPEQSFARPN